MLCCTYMNMDICYKFGQLFFLNPFLLEVTDRACKNLIYAVHCVMGYKDQVEGSYGFLKVISFLEFHA